MNEVARIDEARRQIDAAKTVPEIKDARDKLDAIQAYMRQSGKYGIEEIIEIAELKLLAEWRGGGLLGDTINKGRPKKVSHKAILSDIGIGKDTSSRWQQIAAIPRDELEALLAEARDIGSPVTMALALLKARQFYAKKNREQKHRDIQAATAVNPNIEGLYPLIYADPPWTFDTYSEKGKEISPEKHYPTLTYEEIKSFMVGDRWIGDVTHKDAALFLWCTSSNLESALGVLNAWGFTYKTNAVWDKERTGTGYLFLNQHEHILMGTRGSMPAPVKIFPSVFRSPRGKHSVKPTAVREAIEQMYPHFDKTTRLELFCRSPADGWTATGYEAHHKDAA